MPEQGLTVSPFGILDPVPLPCAPSVTAAGTGDIYATVPSAFHPRGCGLPADGPGIAVQPPPSDSALPAVWDLVMADMRARDAVGAERYGTRLRPHNGRDAMVDAYQEVLDLAVYLRQAIYERDGR